MYINNRFIVSALFVLLCGFFLITTESIAGIMPMPTPPPPPGDCCFADAGGQPGCDNAACEDIVCNIDEICCQESWSQQCVDIANEECSVCTGVPTEPQGCCTDLGDSPDICSVLTEQQCNQQGGDYLGDDTSCNEELSCFQPTLEPLDATSEVFNEHTVTATYLLAGSPEEDVLVEFEIISGPNEGTVSEPEVSESTTSERQVTVRNSIACTPASCRTDANGQVSWTYSSNLLGIDTIIASVDGTPSNEARNEWVILRNIPTLSQWGLIIIAGLLAIAGIVVLKRKKIAFKA